MINNVLLAASFVAALSGAPATADTPLEAAGVDGHTMAILFGANTSFDDSALRDEDLDGCTTVGDFARLIGEAGYAATDEEIAANAAADAADDNDIVLAHLVG